MKTKAAVLYEIGKPLVVDEIEIPELNRGQVLIKMLYSGICRSQLNEIDGLRGKDEYLPHLLGHEGSGIVIETGKDVAKVKKGDYVVLSWIKGNGINAPACQYVKGNTKINVGAITTFSEHAVISENRVFKIDNEVPPPIAALLGCAVPTGAGIIKNELKIESGKSIAIFGIGGVGSSALIYANLSKCSKIIAVDVNDIKLDFARSIGATHCINALKENPIAKICEITNNQGCDYAIEASGIKEVMECAFSSIKDSGIAVIAGNPNKGARISIDPFDLIRGKKIIGTWGGATCPDKDIPYYAEQYLKKNLDIAKLISRTYSLDEINIATDDLRQGRIIRGLIKFE